jgi:hypothetical protein
LYSIFGHSAIRIIDSNNVNDLVYNYGTFNFEDDGFYLKFIRGKLLYYLSIERSDDFFNDYAMAGRGIEEQVLELSSEEKLRLKKAIIENCRLENRYYKYDFFYDNCTSRLRDILLKYKSPSPILPAVMKEKTTFRNAIHLYLDNGKQYWSKLGIDILLGKPTDKIMTPSEQSFLPDNLMMSIEKTADPKLVAFEHKILDQQTAENKEPWFTPFFFFSTLLVVFILMNGISTKVFIKISTLLDVCLFFTVGLLGVILVLMWTSTDHTMTKNNYNLLWAIPTNLFFCFFIPRKNNYTKWYFSIQSFIYLALLVCWFFMPQELNKSLIPFVILLLYRSYSIGFKNGKKSNIQG